MCDCVKEINEKLKELPEGKNTMLVTNLFGTPRAVISTCKRDDKARGKVAILMATFCPFCGEKYQEAVTVADAA